MAEPTITFGSAQGFGAITNWNAQTDSSSVQKDRASVHDKDGNEIASKLYNERTEVSTPYKSGLAGSVPTVPAAVGALLNSLIMTEIRLATTRDDYATMNLSGHNHAVNAHTSTPALRTGTHAMVLADGFGCTDFMAGTAGANAAVQSGSVTIKCEHTDELDADGDHLVGQNYGAMLEAETVWTGVPSANTDGTWDNVTTETGTDSQGFLTTTVRGTKKITMA